MMLTKEQVMKRPHWDGEWLAMVPPDGYDDYDIPHWSLWTIKGAEATPAFKRWARINSAPRVYLHWPHSKMRAA